MRRRRARWRGARRVEAAASRTSGGVAYVPASGGFAIAAAAPVSVVAATDETAAAPTPRYARAVSASARAAEGVENNLRTCHASATHGSRQACDPRRGGPSPRRPTTPREGGGWWVGPPHARATRPPSATEPSGRARSSRRLNDASHLEGDGDRARAVARHLRGRGARLPRRRAGTRCAHDRAPRRSSPARARGDRRRPALHAPAPRVGRRGARRAPDRHDRHSVGEDARLQPARARRARARSEGPRALSLPDEGARAGPVPDALGIPDSAPAPGDLRRRHTRRAALADPPAGERDPVEPGHDS